MLSASRAAWLQPSAGSMGEGLRGLPASLVLLHTELHSLTSGGI